MDTEVKYLSAYENYLIGNIQGAAKVLEEYHKFSYNFLHVSSTGVIHEYYIYEDNDKIWTVSKENFQVTSVEFKYVE